jgi:hypothetical protein
MNTEMHGRKIARIIFDGASSYQIHEVRSEGNVQLELSATYHGDHDEFWVLKLVDGEEVERYAPRLIETITWQSQGKDEVQK